MPEQVETITFKETAGPPGGVEAMRLIRRKDAAALVVSRTAINRDGGAATKFSALLHRNASDSWEPVMETRLMIPARPRWDVSLDSEQRFTFAYENAGGAINDLMLQAAGGALHSFRTGRRGESYSEPRFSRPAGEPPLWVTAIVDGRTCVAFPVSGGPHRTLVEAVECLLIHRAPGFVLITKTRVPGPVRGNDISPGRLQVRRLDDEMRETGPATDPLDGPVFEFDADLIGIRVVIAATTSKGIALASANIPMKFTVNEYAEPFALTSPALVAAEGPGKCLLGALDAEGKSEARILLAETSIPTAP